MARFARLEVLEELTEDGVLAAGVLTGVTAMLHGSTAVNVHLARHTGRPSIWQTALFNNNELIIITYKAPINIFNI